MSWCALLTCCSDIWRQTKHEAYIYFSFSIGGSYVNPTKLIAVGIFYGTNVLNNKKKREREVLHGCPCEINGLNI